MNLGKKLAEGYATDTESIEVPTPAETTGPIPIVTAAEDTDVRTEAPHQPVTA